MHCHATIAIHRLQPVLWLASNKHPFRHRSNSYWWWDSWQSTLHIFGRPPLETRAAVALGAERIVIRDSRKNNRLHCEGSSWLCCCPGRWTCLPRVFLVLTAWSINQAPASGSSAISLIAGVEGWYWANLNKSANGKPENYSIYQITGLGTTSYSGLSIYLCI